MDIKGKIEEIVQKIKSDDNFADEFKKNPTKAIESIIGIDLPDDQINAVIDGVKAKISTDGIGGAFDSVKKLF